METLFEETSNFHIQHKRHKQQQQQQQQQHDPEQQQQCHGTTIL